MTETADIALPDLDALPRIPTGPDDDIVFRAPWEARAFALVVQLHRQGHFSWPQWAATLGEEIRRAGPDSDGSDYYLLWLAAAEKLVAERALCGYDELRALKDTLETAQGGPAPAA